MSWVELKVFLPAGKSLYEKLREEGFLKSAYCGGRGTCGKCVVKVEGKEELACLFFGPFEGKVELQEELLTSAGEALPPLNSYARFSPKKGLGVAIDLGTTGIEGAVFDLSTGEFLRSGKVLNLQSAFGADVVTRVEEAKKHYRKERELLLKSVELLLKKLEVEEFVASVTCNPVMHHFFLGLPVSSFEKFPFEPASREPKTVGAQELQIPFKGEFYLPPPLKGFVGSDLLANLLYLKEREENFLVVDLGTNAEIALWGEEKKAASVPAGPAFEGIGLFSGMRAVEGAIYKVFFDGRNFRFLTVGGKKPLGLCASGYFDLIYLLKSFRALNSEGTFLPEEKLPPLLRERFTEINGERAFVLHQDRENLVALTQSDVRKFLMAKGAVYGALSAICERERPPKLYFSGAFGSHLNERAVKGLKLIPKELPPPVPAGNLSLRGASMLLASDAYRREIESMPEKVEHLELSTNKTFEKNYIKGLEL